MTSPKRTPQRVLLIGAYANGNIGDMYQADAIARELLTVDPTLQVCSASPSKRASNYPAELHEILPSTAVRDPEILNSFDLILVGGGGLLAARHAPLPELGWVDSIKTTLCGLALGCAGAAPAEAKHFIQRCNLFSVRDEFSARVVAPIRKDVNIVLDPIFLTDSDLALRPKSADTRGIVWIPGKLVPNTLSFYSRLHREAFAERADTYVSLNEETDKHSGFEEMFGLGVRYLRALDDFATVLQPRSFAVSERYHGCIFALKMGVPCFGVTLRSDTVTSKISELYRKLGLSDALINDASSLNRKRLNTLSKTYFDFPRITKEIRRERANLHEFLRSCLSEAGRRSN